MAVSLHHREPSCDASDRPPPPGLWALQIPNYDQHPRRLHTHHPNWSRSFVLPRGRHRRRIFARLPVSNTCVDPVA